MTPKLTEINQNNFSNTRLCRENAVNYFKQVQCVNFDNLKIQKTKIKNKLTRNKS